MLNQSCSLLNITFNHLSNPMFNNTLFSGGTILSMHDQMERLYSAAKTLKNVEGQSAVARFLNESPQTVKNWESRGISKSGSVKAQAHIGCDANWLLSGMGSMTSAPHGSASVQSEVSTFDRLAADMRGLGPAAREQAASLLQNLARDPDGPWSTWMVELVNAAPVQTEVSATTVQTLKGINQFETPLVHTIKPKNYKKAAK